MMNNFITKKKFSLLIIFCFFAQLLFAEKIFFSASSMSGKTSDRNSSTILTGDAYVKTETMEIYADSIELSGEDYNKIIAQGNIKGKNIEAKMDFTCSYLEYSRDTKIALLKGDVSLEDLENNVTANAQIIEYSQNSQIATLQIQVKLIQKDNVCTGSYAIYQKQEQLLDISGNAEVKQGEDIFRAQSIFLNLDTQEISLQGNVRGSVTQTQEETQQDKNNLEESLVSEKTEQAESEHKEIESEGKGEQDAFSKR